MDTPCALFAKGEEKLMPITLQHVLWDCSRWQGHPNLKKVYPEVCLWQRALMPASYVQTPLLNTEERLEGDWPTGPLPEDVVIGTDASGSRFFLGSSFACGGMGGHSCPQNSSRSCGFSQGKWCITQALHYCGWGGSLHSQGPGTLPGPS